MCTGQGACGKSLCLLFNFAVNLSYSKKESLLKNKTKQNPAFGLPGVQRILVMCSEGPAPHVLTPAWAGGGEKGWDGGGRT